MRFEKADMPPGVWEELRRRVEPVLNERFAHKAMTTELEYAINEVIQKAWMDMVAEGVAPSGPHGGFVMRLDQYGVLRVESVSLLHPNEPWPWEEGL